MRVRWVTVYQSRSSMNGGECSDSNFHSQNARTQERKNARTQERKNARVYLVVL